MTLGTKVSLLKNFGAWFSKVEQRYWTLRLLLLVPLRISLSSMRVFPCSRTSARLK